MLVANSGTIVPWSCLVKWVPLLHSRHLKKLEEGEAEGNSQPKEHYEEGGLCGVHVGVDIKKENQVRDRDKLREELYRRARPNEDEAEKLKEVGVDKVDTIDLPCICLWKSYHRPEEIARRLHKRKDKERVKNS